MADDMGQEVARGMTRFNPISLIPLMAQKGQASLDDILRMLSMGRSPQPMAPRQSDPLPRFGGIDPVTGQPVIIPPARR